MKASSSCSGFGRYQAVETGAAQANLLSGSIVAVGLAAIRPLKLPLPFTADIGNRVAVGLAAIRPLKRLSYILLSLPDCVAVGLAAIRPLKRRSPS